jgi:hypothetical protein
MWPLFSSTTLSAEQLDRVRPAVFIIHATSPGNHQAWIRASGIPEGKEAFREFMRRVRKAVGGNDKSASHATRVAGTENFKPKYAPEFPRVRIVETHRGRVMTAEQLEALGLLAPPEPPRRAPLQDFAYTHPVPRRAHLAGLSALRCGRPAREGGRRSRSQPGGFCVVHDGRATRLEHRGDREQAA